MQLLNDTFQSGATAIKPLTARARIANATRASHEALHHHSVLSRLMAPDLSGHEYTTILRRYLAFYEVAEEIRRRLQPAPDLSFQPELQLLYADLQGQPTQPARPDLPITTPHQALGLIYVLYGSRFGAKVICKNLRTALPTQDHHFFGDGPRQDRWRYLLSLIEAHGIHQAALREIIAGAEATFCTFDQTIHGDQDRGFRAGQLHKLSQPNPSAPVGSGSPPR